MDLLKEPFQEFAAEQQTTEHADTLDKCIVFDDINIQFVFVFLEPYFNIIKDNHRHALRHFFTW